MKHSFFISRFDVVKRICTEVKITQTEKIKLATVVEGDPKAPFSIATTPRCRGGRYSFP